MKSIEPQIPGWPILSSSCFDKIYLFVSHFLTCMSLSFLQVLIYSIISSLSIMLGTVNLLVALCCLRSRVHSGLAHQQLKNFFLIAISRLVFILSSASKTRNQHRGHHNSVNFKKNQVGFTEEKFMVRSRQDNKTTIFSVWHISLLWILSSLWPPVARSLLQLIWLTKR